MTCLLKQDTLTSPFSQVTNQHKSHNYDHVKGTLRLSKSVHTKKNFCELVYFMFLKDENPKRCCSTKLYTCKPVMFKIKPWFPKTMKVFGGAHFTLWSLNGSFAVEAREKKLWKSFPRQLFLFQVEGDSGIPVTPGIHPKSQVKRRARLFEAWKNDNRKATCK